MKHTRISSRCGCPGTTTSLRITFLTLHSLSVGKELTALSALKTHLHGTPRAKAIARYGLWYLDWYDAHQLEAFPVHHTTLVGFLIWYIQKNSGSTKSIDYVKTALWNFTLELGRKWLPRGEELRCRKLIKLLKYRDIRPTNRKAPLTLNLLNLIYERWAPIQSNHMILTAMYLGHDALLRSAELLSLNASHVKVLNKQQMSIQLLRSKTHRSGAAQAVHICDRPGPSAFKMVSHTLASHRHSNAPLFGNQPRNWLASGIKRAVQEIGENASHYSTHSLRAGGATDLLRANTPLEIIRKAGRWHSDEVLKYLRDEIFVANTCATAFANLNQNEWDTHTHTH